MSDAKAVAELAGIQSSLPTPGTDPRQVAQWWAGMSPEDRLVLCNAFPKRVGGPDGLPAVDRDTANRIYLDYAVRKQEHNHDQMAQLQQILADVNKQRPGQLLLLGFDEAHDGQAVVAIGNADKARHTAVSQNAGRLWSVAA